MAINSELLQKVESLKNMLVTQATGGGGGPDDGEFKSLRAELVGSPRLKSHLPPFLLTCRTSGEFWGFIRHRFAHYRERRDFLREQFDPVLSLLEATSDSPLDASASITLARFDAAHVSDCWQKALDRRATDPEGAITSARALLESVCKHILDEMGAPYEDGEDLPRLYRRTAEGLNLAASQHSRDVYKRILGSCASVVEGLGAMRNKEGDAHGKGRSAVRPAPRHAELAVNLAGAMATFLVQTWEARS